MLDGEKPASMAVPARVESILDEEETIRTRVALGDDVVLYITPSRAITHRKSSLLRDESITTVSTDVERLTLEEGRRTATVTFEHGLRDPEQLSIPANRIDEALPAILEGVLLASGTLGEDERVTGTFTFNELTLVTTDHRLLKHVGRAVWATDFEAFDYDDVTGISTEEGAVATGIVLERGASGIERFKVPNSATRRVIHELEASICAYHEIDSIDELGDDDDISTDEPPTPLLEEDAFDFGVDVDTSAEAPLEALREAVAYHEELLERHRELLDRLEDELTRDR